ncbi:hypothetical protein BD309DRAFT_965610, partial [Dichomitus squalens]
TDPRPNPSCALLALFSNASTWRSIPLCVRRYISPSWISHRAAGELVSMHTAVIELQQKSTYHRNQGAFEKVNCAALSPYRLGI